MEPTDEVLGAQWIRAHVQQIAAASGSTLTWDMRTNPETQNYELSLAANDHHRGMVFDLLAVRRCGAGDAVARAVVEQDIRWVLQFVLPRR
jgi:hypothetical protein